MLARMVKRNSLSLHLGFPERCDIVVISAVIIDSIFVEIVGK